MASGSRQTPPDPEDMFADTRMSFGEHIEDLRLHLWRAIIGFLIGMLLSFFVGKPLVQFIAKPVEDQLEVFYDRRVNRVLEDIKSNPTLDKLNQLQAGDSFIRVSVPTEQLKAAARGDVVPEVDEPGTVPTTQLFLRVDQPLKFAGLQAHAQREVGKRPTLSTLSVQEAFMVFFKVCMVSGLILSSPWVFYQIWAFVAAGLYPSEKRYVHVYLPFSLGLFLCGAAVCQFLVIPKAIEALLWFNEWLGLEPDLRLSEWLGFALMMPLVFGISFQTPLVMLFLGRIGIMTVETYGEFRRIAYMALAIFAAVITPSVDAFSMLFLWVPLCALYELGIFMCKMSPPASPWELDLPGTDVGDIEV
jgi:sec-independent protein translocase protein TatC